MNTFTEKLQYIFLTPVLGNPVWLWAVSFAVGCAVWLLLRIVISKMGSLIERRHEQTNRPILHAISVVLQETNIWCLFFLSLWAATRSLVLPEGLDAWADRLALFAVFLQAALWASEVIDFLIDEKVKRAQTRDISQTTGIAAIRIITKTCLWIFVLLLILSNFGVNISSLVAGLGIGGIAIALAVQQILGDLLCSVSILLDKPFRVGDFIIVDDKMGVVEQIGIKSTRVKSLSGEQLVFSNSDLIASRIRNYKKMVERRVAFAIGVTYQTPLEQLKEMPGVIKEIVESLENTRFDRAHFKAYGAFSLDFEIVYYVLGADYNLYMDIQQEINFQIYQKLAERGIEFAYPTQTLFVEKSVQAQ